MSQENLDDALNACYVQSVRHEAAVNQNTNKKAKVIGYVRIENRDEIYISDQNTHIENFAAKSNLELVQIEHEVSNGQQLVRTGVWRALRMMACNNCEPKQMPMVLDYDFWFKEVMKPCTCKNPAPLDGILVDDIKTLSANPPQGAKFTLDMCTQKKHLYTSSDRKCLSCCNPQAIEFLKRQMLR